MKSIAASLESLSPGSRRVMLYVPTGLLAVVTGMLIPLFPLYAPLLVLAPLVAGMVLLTPRLGIAVLLVFLFVQDPLMILVGLESDAALYLKRADEFLILALGLRCLSIREVRRSFVDHKLYLPLIGCYAGIILSTIVAQPVLPAAAIDLVLFSKPFLVLALGFSLAPSIGLVEKAVPRVIVILLVVLGFGLFFLQFPDLHSSYLGRVISPDQRLGLLSAQGFFTNTGIYSWVGAATFCMSYAAFLAFSKRTYLLYSCASAFFVLLTWRRKSLMVIAVVLLVSLLVTKARGAKTRAALLLALAGVLAVTLLAPYFAALATKTVDEYGTDDPYASARAALYYTSVLIARDHFPLGTGLASFGSHASRLYYSGVYWDYGLARMYGLSPRSSMYVTDTFWPMVLGQGGVITLVSYLTFIAFLGVVAFRTARSSSDAPGRTFLALASVFLVFGSLTESTASHIFGSSLQVSLAFIPVGIFWRHRIDEHA